MFIALAGGRGFIGSKIREAFSEDTFVPLNRENLYGNTSEQARKIEASIIATMGQTVYPKRLLDEGFKFTFDTIEKTIANLVNQV